MRLRILRRGRTTAGWSCAAWCSGEVHRRRIADAGSRRITNRGKNWRRSLAAFRRWSPDDAERALIGFSSRTRAPEPNPARRPTQELHRGNQIAVCVVPGPSHARRIIRSGAPLTRPPLRTAPLEVPEGWAPRGGRYFNGGVARWMLLRALFLSQWASSAHG